MRRVLQEERFPVLSPACAHAEARAEAHAIGEEIVTSRDQKKRLHQEEVWEKE